MKTKEELQRIVEAISPAVLSLVEKQNHLIKEAQGLTDRYQALMLKRREILDKEFSRCTSSLEYYSEIIKDATDGYRLDDIFILEDIGKGRRRTTTLFLKYPETIVPNAPTKEDVEEEIMKSIMEEKMNATEETEKEIENEPEEWNYPDPFADVSETPQEKPKRKSERVAVVSLDADLGEDSQDEECPF